MDSVNIWLSLGWLQDTHVCPSTPSSARRCCRTHAEILVCAARWVDAIIDVRDELSYFKTEMVPVPRRHPGAGSPSSAPMSFSGARMTMSRSRSWVPSRTILGWSSTSRTLSTSTGA
jgi:hypothetical protein